MNQYPDDFDALDAAPNASAGGLDFVKFLRGFWQRKWLILLLMLLFAYLFHRQAQKVVPEYKTNLVIQARSFDPDAERLMTLDRLIEMKSRSFYEQLTAKLGLALSLSDTNGSVWDNGIFAEFSTTTTPTPGKYLLRIDDSGRFFLFQTEPRGMVNALDSCSVWDVVDQSRSVNGFTFRLRPDFVAMKKEVSFKINPFEQAIGQLTSSVTVNFSNKSGLMTLTMTGTDYQTLPARLNRIAEIYRKESIGLKDRDVNRNRRNLELKKDAAEKALKEAEVNLRIFQERYPLSLEHEKKNISEELGTVNKLMRELPIYREQISGLLEKLNTADPGVDPEQFRQFIVNELCHYNPMSEETYLKVLSNQLSQQFADLKKLDANYGEISKEYKTQKQKIKKTQDEIIAFASQYRSQLVEQEKQAREKQTAVMNRQRQLPSDESVLADLQRQKKICEGNYATILEEMQKNDLIENVQGEEISILDPASRPTSETVSKTKKIAIGASLGLFLGLLISAGIDFMDKSIRTVDDIENFLKLPVLGAIPVVDFKDIPEYHDFEKAKHIDRQLVTHDYSPTPIGESYRALRTQILFSKKRERIHTLVLTSVAPEEGKSFTASNLAIIFAQQRTNTLLVDADLRRGVLHNTFRMKKEPGLANYLSGSVTLSEAVQQTHVPNLSFISYGTLMPNPSELLGSLQMQRFLNEVRRKFDLILFDSPPLEAATDAVVIGTQVDAVAMVVRSGKTQRNVAKDKLEIFNSVPVNLIGTILNGAEAVLVQNYSYYHY